MGRAGALTKARQHDSRQKHQQRAQRSEAARERRRGDEHAARLVQRVFTRRPLPSAENKALLLAQFAQACRLPQPAMDLCAVLRHCIVAVNGQQEQQQQQETGQDTSASARPSRKRTRSEAAETQEDKKSKKREEGGGAEAKAEALKTLHAIAQALLQAETAPAGDLDAEDEAANDVSGEGDEEEEDAGAATPMLLEILRDDNGRRVVSTLLQALHEAHAAAECDAVAKVVLGQFEEEEHLAAHHIACRVLSALVQYGSPQVQHAVLRLMQERCTGVEQLRGVLTDRHTAVTITHLLRQLPVETSEWLCVVLDLHPAQREAGNAKAAKKKDDEGVAGPRPDAELLLGLVNDAVAGAVLRQLLVSYPPVRAWLLRCLDETALLQTKRGTGFLTELLHVKEEEEQKGKESATGQEMGAVFAAMLKRLSERVVPLSMDGQGNFVVQQLLRLVPHTAKAATANLTQLVTLLRPALPTLAGHANGVHVVLTLIDVALQLRPASAQLVEELGACLVTRDTVHEMTRQGNGSLVVRHLMPLVAGKDSRTGAVLRAAIESDPIALSYDAVGNLVMQAYLRARGASYASALARRVMSQQELLRMSCSPAAAHVICALLDCVDPSTQTAMCAALTPHAVTLATHVNGRFIVEKIIAASRELRTQLMRNFRALAEQKGVQHVFCCLAAHLDARGKEELVARIIVPQLEAIAQTQYGSITLQKLMQSDADVLQAVRNALDTNPALRTTLAQNFYGKYVVHIADN